MHVIDAKFHMNDDADPPTASISIAIDGRPLANTDVADVGQWIAAVDALSAGAGLDLRAELVPILEQVLSRARAVAEHGRALQESREQALTDWTAAQDALQTEPA